MKHMNVINLVAILCNILCMVLWHCLDCLNIYIVVGTLIVSGVITFTIGYNKAYKRVRKAISFVSELDIRNITERDIEEFSKMEFGSIKELNSLKSDVRDLLLMLKTSNDKVKHLKYESTHDDLTGLCNRARLSENKIRYQNEATDIAIVFFDLNNLKRVNDTLGHDDGDLMLIKSADVLSYWRRYGEVYRIGGDEFLVVIMNKNTAYIAEHLEEWFSTLMPFNDYKSDGFKCELVYGLSVHHGSDFDFDKLMEEADTNMYAMKQQSKKLC